jgi:hypothetical protein
MDFSHLTTSLIAACGERAAVEEESTSSRPTHQRVVAIAAAVRQEEASSIVRPSQPEFAHPASPRPIDALNVIAATHAKGNEHGRTINR